LRAIVRIQRANPAITPAGRRALMEVFTLSI
jgi:hypothetical protein